MPSSLSLRPSVLAAKDWLAQERAKLQATARRRLAGHSGLHAADGNARSCGAGNLLGRADRFGRRRRFSAARRNRIGGARRLWPGRRGAVFRCRLDDSLCPRRRQPSGSAGQTAAARFIRCRTDIGPKRAHSGRSLPAGIERFDHFHLVGRIAVARRQRGIISAFSGIVPKSSPAALAPIGSRHPRIARDRAQPIRRNGVSAGAERQALAGRTARHSVAPLGRLRPLRPGHPRWPAIDGRSVQRRRNGAAPRTRVSAARAQRIALSRRRKNTTCSTAPSRCAWPACLAMPARREFCRSKNSCASIFATPTPCSRWSAGFWKARNHG